MTMIPVLRPKLPTENAISPYLRRIDTARWYSNFGPLVNEFEARLSEHFHVDRKMVTTAANGTLVLSTLLNALDVPKGSLCVMPSWTFIATPAAALAAGLTPYFVDVDRETQTLDPHSLLKEIHDLHEKVGAIIVVAPFGTPLNTHVWDAFSEQTGIPVIIDAAAGFDTVGQSDIMQVGSSPVMVSLHATKVLGIGEAGVALSTNTDLIWRTKSFTGYGFNNEREALIPGINAKLPEYTAAVGLAALDEYPNNKAAWQSNINRYIDHFERLQIQHMLSRDWVTSTCNVILPNSANSTATALRQQNVDTRKWWLEGCHGHRAYQDCRRSANLTNTKWLGEAVIGLPLAVDITPEQIDYVCQQLEIILTANELSETAS